MPRGKRNTPFQPGHGLHYGLRPVTRDPETNAVTSVACRFCEKFGRQEKVGSKRRATQRIKHFRQPFRTENYHQHHVGQHSTRWNEYKVLPPESKFIFLASETPAQHPYTHIEDVVSDPTASSATPPVAQQQPVVQTATVEHEILPPLPLVKKSQKSRPITFIIDRPIVDVIIGEILLDPTAEITKERAITSFTLSHESIVDYTVNIKHTKLFDITVEYVRLGATPKIATALIVKMARAICQSDGSAQHFEECSHSKVSAYVRCAIAHNLQAISDLLRSTWAFSLCLECAHYLNTAYVEVSVRFCGADDIHKFHLISFPSPNHLNLDPIYKSLSCVIHILCPNWREKLIGITTDGSAMAHTALKGIVERFCRVSSKNLIRTWSGAHQLDIVIRSVYRSVLDEEFYDILSKLIAYLRRQERLIRELKSSCPKVALSSWLSIERALRWIKTHRIRILQYLDEKKPGFGPDMSWWVLAMALYEFTHSMSKTYRRIRGCTRLVAQQTIPLSELVQTLRRISGCKGPVTDDELSLLNEWDLLTTKNYVIQKSAIRNFLSGLGSFVHISMTELPNPSLNDVLNAVGTMFLEAVVGLTEVVDSWGEFTVGASALPPVLPHELIEQTRAAFNAEVRNQGHRLSTTFSPAEIEKIEEEFGEFLEGYHREETFKVALQAVDPYKDFSSAWGALRGRFETLFLYCGGLGSAYPGIFSVEHPFTIQPPAEKMFQNSRLTDFSLEGSLQCEQYQRLRSLLEAVRS